ncbi:cell division protein BolA [Catenovulum agarivorans DS-2]|uniref:Cell division protein BolA n=1 Tax=Catenovulum agarivorans DS-2 TaxID=1328313 RepID=W7QQV8_9ALTE|nr:BolA/IbaG family iron-sulfur metabolism protein [Catenovulum agarivorans]EWH11382.1 cell division protein BolA [Catenovulum agarivorans DS-2]
MTIDEVIFDKLKGKFNPVELDVQNESHMHSGPATDSHYKVIVVSEIFDGLRLIQRHRAINECLAEELAGPVHALSIHTYSVKEWQNGDVNVPLSPKCLGGSKSD